MNGVTMRNTPVARLMRSRGDERNFRRPSQSSHPGPWESHQNSGAYVENFENEIKKKLETTAERRFPDSPSEQDEWFNMKFAKFKDVQKNYTPRQDTTPRSPNDSLKIEGLIVYLAKTPADTPDANRLRCMVRKLDLTGSSTVEQSLRKAQDDWNSAYGPGDPGESPPIQWFHLPANNMKWVEFVMPSVMAMRYTNSFPERTNWNRMAEQVFEPEFWDHQCRSDKRNPVFSRTMEPFATYIDGNLEAQSTHPSEDRVDVLAAFMPYLHWESSVAATYMRHVVRDAEERYRKKNENPLPGEQMSQDEVLLRNHLFQEPFVHPRRTLDQFYYPLLVDTSERDGDQVVERYAVGGHFDDQAHYDSEPPILMVDQCWVWAIGSNTVVTAFPKTWNGHAQYWDPLDLQTTILNNIRKPRHRHYLNCATEFARFVLRVSAVNLLQPSKQIREPQKFLQYFDYAIAELRQRKIDTSREPQLWWDPRQTSEEKLQTLNAIFHVQKDYEALEEANDILEELQMIRELLDDQDSTMRQFEQAQKRFQAKSGVPQYNKSKRQESEIGSFMIERPAMVMRRANVDRLIRKVREAREDIQSQLGVKNQQAGMIEAQFTRGLSEQASQQSIILMVFTAVTIVFLPLSTMAAMFGINAVDLGSGSMSLGTIFAYIFPISVMCVVISLTASLNRRSREWLFGKPDAYYTKLFSSERNDNDRSGNPKGSVYQIPSDRPQSRFTTDSRNDSASLHSHERRPPTSGSREITQSSVPMDVLVPSDPSSRPTKSILRRNNRTGQSRRLGRPRRQNSRFTRMNPELWREEDAPELSLSEGEDGSELDQAKEEPVGSVLMVKPTVSP